MEKKLGEGFFKDPNDDAEAAKRREAQADAMKPEDKTTIEVWHNGAKYAIPYNTFLKKFGNPKQYKPEEVMQKIMRHSLGL